VIGFLSSLRGICPVLGIGAALVAMHLITQKYHRWILAFINAYDSDRKYFRRPWSTMGPAVNMFALHDPSGELSDEIHVQWKILIRSFWIELFKHVSLILFATFLALQGILFLIGLVEYS
jgi:hypothetical protein